MTEAEKLATTVQFATAMGWPESTYTHDVQPDTYYWIRAATGQVYVRKPSAESTLFTPWTSPTDAIEMADKLFVHREHDSHTLRSGERTYAFIGFAGTPEDHDPTPYVATGASDCEAICLAVLKCLEASEQGPE